jgi:hypothetical protein
VEREKEMKKQKTIQDWQKEIDNPTIEWDRVESVERVPQTPDWFDLVQLVALLVFTPLLGWLNLALLSIERPLPFWVWLGFGGGFLMLLGILISTMVELRKPEGHKITYRLEERPPSARTLPFPRQRETIIVTREGQTLLIVPKGKGEAKPSYRRFGPYPSLFRLDKPEDGDE